MPEESKLIRPEWNTLYELEKAGVSAAEAEAKKYMSEAVYYKSLAKQMDLDAEQKKIQIEVLKIKKEQIDEQRKEEQAQDRFHRLFVYTKKVDEDSVAECIKALRSWDRQDSTCDMELMFNSPGGDMIQGMMLFDYIRSLTRTHEVTTRTYGMAASMAGILMQAGSHRVMGAEAWLMMHEISFQAFGKASEVDDMQEWIKRVQERIITIFATRSTMDADTIRDKWKRKDWWVDSDEALELLLIDEIR